MRRITLNVAQGIGDIFWVVQKFHDHVDRIDLNVCVLESDQIQTRARRFLRLFPKVGAVTWKFVGNSQYDALVKGRFPMVGILGNERSSHDYCCNAPLESGIRLEAIDPEYSVAWGLDIPSEVTRLPSDHYLLVYVSGSHPEPPWDANRWASLIRRASAKLELPVVLFGASYDFKAIVAVEEVLKQSGVKCQQSVGLPPTRALHVLRNADYFLGYQSGLNILADNYGVRQAMIYYPQLAPMQYAWCRPEHQHTLFRAFTFDQPEDVIVEQL